MKVYAYYQSIPASNQAEEFACANWWATSWKANGWEPIMLNRSHAAGCPLTNKLHQKLAQMAMGHPAIAARLAWVNARFARWCALHAAGGGWMSDYDVLNLDLTPQHAKAAETKTLLVNHSSPAYLFYATKEHCLNAIKKFIAEDLLSEGEILPEIDILGVAPELHTIMDRVQHIHGRGDRSKSVRMKDIFENDQKVLAGV